MKTTITILALFFYISLFAQNPVVNTGNNSYTYYVSQIFQGNNLYISNVTTNLATGGSIAIGHFQNFNLLGIDEGVILSTGNAADAVPPNASSSTSSTISTGTDSLLATLVPGFDINDAVIIEFDYIPYTNVVSFDYIFASEEYPEFVNSSFNDVFGFFVSGENPYDSIPYNYKNIALIPNTNLSVTIDNVNHNTNSSFYIAGNTSNACEYDGRTVVLEANLNVVPFTTYHFKIAIADAGDSSYDSAVFLRKESFSAYPVVFKMDTIESKEFRITEADTLLKLQISLPDTTPYPITYSFNTSGSSANNFDFQINTDSIYYTPNTISQELDIYIFEDSLAEAEDTILIAFDYLQDTIRIIIEDDDSLVNSNFNLKKHEIAIYPNPVKDKLNLSYPSDFNKYEIIDINGRIIKKGILENSLEVSSLTKGTYFIKLYSGKKFIQKLFIKE